MNCSSLISITLPDSFVTTKVTDMSHLFSYCTKAYVIDTGNLTCESATDMQSMFAGDKVLQTVYLQSCYDSGNLSNISTSLMWDNVYSTITVWVKNATMKYFFDTYEFPSKGTFKY
jgi:hypothetical protein